MPLFFEWFGAGPQSLAGWFARIANSCATINHASRILYPGTSRFARWRRIRFWLRSLLWWRTTTTWLERCATSPLSSLVERQPVALERMHRPFLHGCFNARERLKASLDHCAITQQRAPRLANRIAFEGRVSIARISVDADSWDVSLESIGHFQREGDWSLCIRDASGRRVVSCTFSLAYLGGKVLRPRMCIGAVQGPDKSMNGRDLFRTLTKKWLGLRPKVFAIYLAQNVAQTLGMGSTFIVSKHAHVYSNWRYCLRKKRVSADYDNLSRECGAFATWNGWFVLAPPRLDLADRDDSAKGNALRRKRNALREDVVLQIRERLRA
ncbi:MULTISPECIES: VirK/YbjX family protein [Burkholderiaceae]|uniref:Virulence factor VirK n=1 Tax=Caballeronia sordidicola TaxID=196367 RepID=A0A242MYZ0_CABSO|nr:MULTISPECIES: DUF535 family protein [Burkholderiaceae]AME23280.1 hypothetical protein AXG89_04960 [Burkholderia sp. PAMC 26561]OTP76640.1 Virulence factor VirK [Caballeronia sordidicola]